MPENHETKPGQFGRTVYLVNVNDERDYASVVMSVNPFPGMHLDVPWSESRHEVDYAYWSYETDTLRLGCVPIDRGRDAG